MTHPLIIGLQLQVF